MSPARSKSSNEKVRAHRDRLRRQGLRPIQIWAPDVNAPGFAEEIAREGRLIAASARAEEDQAFVDAITIDW
jgi:hypothetical protein